MSLNNILSKFGIFQLEDFLDAQFCAELRGAAEAASLGQAAIYTEQGMKIDETIRRTKSAKLSGPVVSRLTAKLMDLKPTIEAYFKLTLSSCQDPHLLVYTEGDFFNPHRDNSLAPNERRVSVVVYLKSESKEVSPTTYGGGSLCFYELMKDPRGKSIGFPVAGKEGLLVAFKADSYHAVMPVTHGERLTMVTWFF